MMFESNQSMLPDDSGADSELLADDNQVDLDDQPSPERALMQYQQKVSTHLCQVCGQTAVGFHYGAYVCEACKKFFLRHAHADHSSKSGHPGTYQICPSGGSCRLDGPGRGKCQICRYQACLSLGMSLIRMGSGCNISQIPCRICGGPSSGFHFGALTCEGCKGFFRRTVDCGRLLECPANNSCPITSVNRNLCKSCRFQRCLQAGMSKSGSRIGRQPNAVKFHCVREIEQLIHQQPHSSGSIPSTSVAAAVSGSCPSGTSSISSCTPPSSPHSSKLRQSSGNNIDKKLKLTGVKRKQPSSAVNNEDSLPSATICWGTTATSPPTWKQQSVTGQQIRKARTAAKPTVTGVHSVASLFDLASSSPPSLQLAVVPPRIAHVQGTMKVEEVEGCGQSTDHCRSTSMESTSQVDEKPGQLRKPALADDKPTLDQFLHGVKVASIVLDNQKSTLKNYFPSRRSPLLISDTTEFVWGVMMSHFITHSQFIVNFAKMIPGFNELSLVDRRQLVRDAMYPLMLLELSRDFSVDTTAAGEGEYNYFDFSRTERDVILHHFPILKPITVHLIRSGEAIRQLQLDTLELALLCCLEIFQNHSTLTDLYACRRLHVMASQSLIRHILMGESACLSSYGVENTLCPPLSPQRCCERLSALSCIGPMLEQMNSEHHLVIAQLRLAYPSLNFPELYMEMFQLPYPPSTEEQGPAQKRMNIDEAHVT